MRDRAFHFYVHAVHLPQINLPAVVSPKDVARKIRVEVAGALDMPVGGDGSVRDRAPRVDAQAIHFPEIDLPVVVAPKDVAVEVAVEVVQPLRILSDSRVKVLLPKTW